MRLPLIFPVTDAPFVPGSGARSLELEDIPISQWQTVVLSSVFEPGTKPPSDIYLNNYYRRSVFRLFCRPGKRAAWRRPCAAVVRCSVVAGPANRPEGPAAIDAQNPDIHRCRRECHAPLSVAVVNSRRAKPIEGMRARAARWTERRLARSDARSAIDAPPQPYRCSYCSCAVSGLVIARIFASIRGTAALVAWFTARYQTPRSAGEPPAPLYPAAMPLVSRSLARAHTLPALSRARSQPSHQRRCQRDHAHTSRPFEKGPYATRPPCASAERSISAY